jgi:predicted DNA-binding transcriptional regulator YafY
MEVVRLSRSPFKTRIHPDFQPSDFFKNSLGLFRRTSTSEKITLQVNPDSWIKEYLPKYPIHPSQKQISTFSYELYLEINQDVENFLLRYATELQVIEPIQLRIKLKENLKKALQLYQ